MLIQKQHNPLEQVDQTILLLTIKSHLIKWLPVESIYNFKHEILSHFKNDKHAFELRKKLDEQKTFDDQLQQQILKEAQKVVLKITKNINEYKPGTFGNISEYQNLGK
ncbi:hypothetical protein mmcaprivi_00200 [Mycoplasma mycoides]|nr:hypothetical protein mmcaprivi_00200 [Mycoplasma mycoides]